MSVTLTPPVRVAALVAALVLAGLGAFVLLLGRGGAEDSATPAVAATRPTTQAKADAKRHATRAATRSRPRSSTTPSGFPRPIDHALRYRRVVVVTVYVPGAAVDAVVKREARAGAQRSKAAFVAIRASSEGALQRLIAKTGILPAPAVLVIRRPGVVTATLGVTDRETVAQAVVQARQVQR